MKIVKMSLKILTFIFIGILLLVLLFNIISIIKRVLLKEQMPLIFGFGTSVVITGSMEPTIAPGDVVIIRKCDEYNTGDIVTFKLNSYITHRIVEKTSDGYFTQGDANNTRDREVISDSIVGKVVKIIPKAGNFILFIQDPIRLLILIIFLIAIFEAPPIIITRLRKGTDE